MPDTVRTHAEILELLTVAAEFLEEPEDPNLITQQKMRDFAVTVFSEIDGDDGSLVEQVTTIPIVSGSDDGFETPSTGTVTLVNQDANAVADKILAFRFQDIPVPDNSQFISAKIQFTSNTNATGTNNATIWCEAADSAAALTTANGNLTSRVKGSASVAWAIPDWIDGQRGSEQLTPDLTALFNEIFDRPGWAADNDVVVLIEGGPNTRQFVQQDHATKEEAALLITWMGPAPVGLEGTDVEQFRGSFADTPAGNTSVFQNAMAAIKAAGGGRLTLSRSYELNGRVDLPDKIILDGNRHELFCNSVGVDDCFQIESGASITLLNVRGKVTSAAHAWLKGFSSFNDLTVRDCEFYGDATAPFSLLRFQNAIFKRCLITGCRFHDGRTGIHFNDTSPLDDNMEEIIITHNFFYDMRTSGMGINSPGSEGAGAKRVIVGFNSFKHIVSDAGDGFSVVDFAGTYDLQFIYNTIDDYEANGIWIEDDNDHLSIVGNHILNQTVGGTSSNGQRRPIGVLRCTHGLIANNTVRGIDSDNPAIFLSSDGEGDTDGFDIYGNRLFNNTGAGNGHGIQIAGDDVPSRVHDNYIDSFAGSGIRVAPRSRVYNNDVKDTVGNSYRIHGFSVHTRVVLHDNTSHFTGGSTARHVEREAPGVGIERNNQVNWGGVIQAERAPDPLFDLANLTLDIWLEMTGIGTLTGSVSGTYADSDLSDEVAIDAALEGIETCTEWVSSVNAHEFGGATAWLTDAESDFSIAMLDFDGVDDFLSIAGDTGILDLSGGAFAFAAVIEPDQVSGEASIFQTRHANASRFGIMVNGGEVRATLFNGTTSFSVSGPVSAGTKYVVQYTCDGVAAKLYLNGVLQSGTTGAPHNTVADTDIGRRRGTSAFFNGRIGAILARVGAPWDDTDRQEIDRYLDSEYGAGALGWVDLFSVGAMAKGLVSVAAATGSTLSVLDQEIEWANSTLTLETPLQDTTGAGQIELQVDGGVLKARIASVSGGESYSFNTAFTGTISHG